jgi:hypothetical protein
MYNHLRISYSKYNNHIDKRNGVKTLAYCVINFDYKKSVFGQLKTCIIYYIYILIK